jgi:hypothetical protein
VVKKVIFLLDISQEPGGYAPEITALTRPWLERYARKIGADIHIITERKFPEWDLDYEKLQIYDLIPKLGAEWAIYIDSDALVHPELPDLTQLVPQHHVAHNGADFAPVRWAYDEAGYFQRDGRHIGSCNWLAVAHRYCRDLWHPLDDLTMEQAVLNIHPIPEELRPPDYPQPEMVPHPTQPGSWIKKYPDGEPKAIVTAAHLISDYALSRNIARFGLKFVTLNDLWKARGMAPYFLHHEYTTTVAAKAQHIKAVLAGWKL